MLLEKDFLLTTRLCRCVALCQSEACNRTERCSGPSERNTGMIDGLPLSFFLPLVVHGLAGLTTGITGVITFRAPKGPGCHHRWGQRYLWAYSTVFLTATILSVQRWQADAYLFGLSVLGSSLALGGYTARRFR